MNEDDIMALISAGDINALEQLYKTTYKKVFVFILSMTKCRQTAEDLMHDTYMRIFEKAKNYQIGTNANTWIMTIARNLTYDYFRKTKNITAFDESFTDNSTTNSYDKSENMYDSAISIIENIDLEYALKKLSILDAEIVVLYAVCGYKHREVSKILSMPEGTIRRRYSESIRKLEIELGGVYNVGV